MCVKAPFLSPKTTRGMGTSVRRNDSWDRFGSQAFACDWLMVSLNNIDQS